MISPIIMEHVQLLGTLEKNNEPAQHTFGSDALTAKQISKKVKYCF